MKEIEITGNRVGLFESVSWDIWYFRLKVDKITCYFKPPARLHFSPFSPIKHTIVKHLRLLIVWLYFRVPADVIPKIEIPPAHIVRYVKSFIDLYYRTTTTAGSPLPFSLF